MRNVRNGQRSAPIQPLTTATTGNVTSSNASVQVRMRSTAFMGLHLRCKRDW